MFLADFEDGDGTKAMKIIEIEKKEEIKGFHGFKSGTIGVQSR
jgi:hypothetical protein